MSAEHHTSDINRNDTSNTIDGVTGRKVGDRIFKVINLNTPEGTGRQHEAERNSAGKNTQQSDPATRRRQLQEDSDIYARQAEAMAGYTSDEERRFGFRRYGNEGEDGFKAHDASRRLEEVREYRSLEREDLYEGVLSKPLPSRDRNSLIENPPTPEEIEVAKKAYSKGWTLNERIENIINGFGATIRQNLEEQRSASLRTIDDSPYALTPEGLAEKQREDERFEVLLKRVHDNRSS